MPLDLLRDPSGHRSRGGTKHISKFTFDESAARCIHIGLVNNMPDGALESTERQFQAILDSAAKGFVVRLSLFALPEVPRNEPGRLRIERCYSGISNLWNSHLDGLIVTGAEPKAANLSDEPYWGTLTNVFDWAEQHTHSTVFSCLAAHAAVQHLDGIRRRRLHEKRFGVFDCLRVSEHWLTAGVPSPLRMPHSRWNDLPENELAACGYTVLTRDKSGGVDTFVKQRNSLFLFFQGHPEYESDTLLLEYRRDLGRYFRGERETCPAVPEGCFDRETVDLFKRLQQQDRPAGNHRLQDVLPVTEIGNTWSSVAVQFYSNWLAYLCQQKALKRRGHATRSNAAKA